MVWGWGHSVPCLVVQCPSAAALRSLPGTSCHELALWAQLCGHRAPKFRVVPWVLMSRILFLCLLQWEVPPMSVHPEAMVAPIGPYPRCPWHLVWHSHWVHHSAPLRSLSLLSYQNPSALTPLNHHSP